MLLVETVEDFISILSDLQIAAYDFSTDEQAALDTVNAFEEVSSLLGDAESALRALY